MAKTIATLLGVVFLLVGILGFVATDANGELMGMHLNTPHNIVHLVSGALSLYIGLKGNLSAARLFCLVFGLVYLLLGVVGYLMGDAASDRMWEVAGLMLGRMDHIIHILLGLLYLIGGLTTRAGDATRADVA